MIIEQHPVTAHLAPQFTFYLGNARLRILDFIASSKQAIRLVGSTDGTQ